jgi:hypothetical protein
VQDTKTGIRLLSNVAFFQGKAKAYESSLVELTELNARERKAAVFQLDVPLTSLKPGFYTCQVNVIDDAGGHFLFPRLALLIRQESASAATHRERIPVEVHGVTRAFYVSRLFVIVTLTFLCGRGWEHAANRCRR